MRLRSKNRSFGAAGRQVKSSRRSGRAFVTLLAFCLAFVEAAFAVHLGKAGLATTASRSGALYMGPITLLTSGALKSVLSTSTERLEIFRQLAFSVALLSLAMVAGKDRVERAATFLWSFGIFIVSVYVVRFLLSGTPRSLLSKDVFILLPRSIVIPVYLPLSVAAVMLIVSAFIFALRNSRHIGRLTL